MAQFQLCNPARSPARRYRQSLLATGMTLACLALPAWAAESPADLLTNDTAMASLIWRTNPDVRQALLAEQQAHADTLRAQPLGNPTVDTGFVSLPFANMPQGLDALHAPAGIVGITQPVDIGKRPLRIQRAQLGERLAHLQTLDVHKQRTADLIGVTARLAVTQMRIAVLADQVEQSRELTQLSFLSAKEGFAAPLDREKLEIETARVQILLENARLAQEQAKADWTRLTLQPAPTIDNATAEKVVAHLARLPGTWPDATKALEGLPARQTLRLQAEQAGVDLNLAKMQWLPDLGFRLGYTYDTLPGNAPHSVAGSLSYAIPVWQAGQGDQLDAESRQALATATLQNQQDTLLHQANALRLRATNLARLADSVQRERLPAARATLARLGKALRARGIPLTDVIQVRRTMLDLEGDRVDLLDQLTATLIDYRRLLAWQLPDPEGNTP